MEYDIQAGIVEKEPEGAAEDGEDPEGYQATYGEEEPIADRFDRYRDQERAVAN